MEISLENLYVDLGASRVKREKTSLPVDVTGSNTLAQLPDKESA